MPLGLAEQGCHARILRGVAGVYRIVDAEAGIAGQAVARGLFRKNGHKPLPGDFVSWERSGDPDIPFVITAIEPRRNELVRPPLANVDVLILTASAAKPDVDYHLLDRMLAYALFHEIEPVLVLTKLDLPGTELSRERFTRNYINADFPVFYPDLRDENTLIPLKQAIRGKFAAFCGQSGAGKSTLMNRMMGRELLGTGVLSEKAGRGRQTTRSIEIYEVEDYYLADTPGFQFLDFAMLGLTGEDLPSAYPEIEAISHLCRFHNCRHLGEAGCAIGKAQIEEERLERYREFRKMLDALKTY